MAARGRRLRSEFPVLLIQKLFRLLKMEDSPQKI